MYLRARFCCVEPPDFRSVYLRARFSSRVPAGSVLLRGAPRFWFRVPAGLLNVTGSVCNSCRLEKQRTGALVQRILKHLQKLFWFSIFDPPAFPESRKSVKMFGFKMLHLFPKTVDCANVIACRRSCVYGGWRWSIGSVTTVENRRRH